MIQEGYHLYLAGGPDPNVMRLTCLGMLDDMWRSRAITLEEIRSGARPRRDPGDGRPREPSTLSTERSSADEPTDADRHGSPNRTQVGRLASATLARSLGALGRTRPEGPP